MTKPIRGGNEPQGAWITRHICRSAIPFVERAVSDGTGRSALPHLVAESFVRSVIAEIGFAPSLAVGLSDPIEGGSFDHGQPRPRFRLASATMGKPDSTFLYVLVHCGLPVRGAEISVTLVGTSPSLIEASIHVPLDLPESMAGAPKGRFLPSNIDDAALGELLGLPRQVDIASKRLVVYRVEPENFGLAGRIITALGLEGPTPLSSRAPVSRLTREGNFVFASEVVFDYAPPGMRKGRWRIVLDPKTGALLHAERIARDVLAAEWREPIPEPRADRVPAPAAARFPELYDPDAPGGGWVNILRIAANSAAMAARVFRGSGEAR